MKVAVIVQCRLGSSRLEGKALLPLNGVPILEYALRAMKKVPADEYCLATDADSAPRLAPVAVRCGFSVVEGPLDDVLERYCIAIRKTGADVVLRATADNPFLFFDAAADSVKKFVELREKSGSDYMTYSGLPHGSGIEVFSAESLLRASSLTDERYDREHVGPALYKHPENFKADFIPAPGRWLNPDLRTTVDTMDDYLRAQRLESVLRERGNSFPFESAAIQEAAMLDEVRHPVLLVPSVKKGRGTGHLRRCLELASATGADIFVPEGCTLSQAQAIVGEYAGSGRIRLRQVKKSLPAGGYSLVVADSFALERKAASELRRLAPLCAIDDGSKNSNFFDYMMDIIPGIQKRRSVNSENPEFIPLPKNRRSVEARVKGESEIRSVLVAIGGEDPAGLAARYKERFCALGKSVTVVDSAHPVLNLKEELHLYDLVVTHYGFTAFEAAVAGCAVLLAASTPLHKALAQKYGFALEYPAAGADVSALFPSKFMEKIGADGAKDNSLAESLRSLARSHYYCCPVCGKKADSCCPDKVIARSEGKTYRLCRSCSIEYLAFSREREAVRYDRAYFFEDYKAQYGKTYEEDFASIRGQCLRRMGIVRGLLKEGFSSGGSASLDVGCALGASLSASEELGFAAFGTDISADAVAAAREKGFRAEASAFPDCDAENLFGRKSFDALTMWYVIEHFENLDSVLKKVSSLVRPGGIFAFSTPSGSGASARFSPKTFFEQSPGDHYSVWRPQKAARILARYGFKVERVVSTGIHPERLPFFKNPDTDTIDKNRLRFKAMEKICRLFKWGDTCEIYCRRLPPREGL